MRTAGFQSDNTMRGTTMQISLRRTLVLAVTLFSFQLHAQEVRLAWGETGSYSMTERSDWSRYDNGKYVGHVYREVRSSITPRTMNAGGSFLYRGNFYVLEETLRDMRQNAQGVDAVVPVNFSVSHDGRVSIDNDQGLPSLRGFPAFPEEAVVPGSKWTARGSRAVDPLNQGLPVLVPLIAEYEYRGIETYREVPVHRISARYAARFTGGTEQSGGFGDTQSPAFTNLQGTHTVDILIRVADGLPLMMRDNLDETYTWADGKTVRFRGFTLIFNEGTLPLNRDTLIAGLKSISAEPAPAVKVPSQPSDAAIKPTPVSVTARPGAIPPTVTSLPGVDVTEFSEGIRLTLRDIRFAPDSADILSGEENRLNLIAQALQEANGRTILVEGHTAAVGRPDGEMELSIGRAKRISDELVRRGVPASQLIYKGWGGTRPVGDNTNDAGRQMNRRVEITILE
jgi:outer membrane protein OmpA-like peptidoglycan-associated protein